MKLLVARGILDQLVTHARECLPEEACGFLVGRGDSAERFVPALNILRSSTRFSVQPQFLFDFFRNLRRTGEEMVAVFHSHPSGPAVPSNRDIAEAHYIDVAYVIVSLADERPDIRAWRLAADEAMEIELRAIV